MNRYFFIFSFLLMGALGSLMAQETVELKKDYPNGKPLIRAFITADSSYHGPFESYYSNGNIKEKGRFEHNKRVGLWLQYYKTGDTLSLVNYTNGPFKMWYEDKKIHVVGQIVNEEKQGVFLEYHPNGKIKSEEVFEHSKLNGNCKYHNEEGKIIEIHAYKNGLFDGEWTSFYPNGNKRMQGFYVQGNKSDLWREWYLDGALMLNRLPKMEIIGLILEMEKLKSLERWWKAYDKELGRFFTTKVKRQNIIAL